MTLMVVHHFLYNFLDGTVVGVRFDLRGQALSVALGNLIANGARVALAAMISIVFAQLLWLHLRTHSFTVSHVNALIACNNNPFNPTAISTWFSSAFFLALLALFGILMSAITIFAPGALSITQSDVGLSDSCTVHTVDFSTDFQFMQYNLAGVGAPLEVVHSLVTKVLIQGTYIMPLSRCGGKTCRYNLEFLGPAVNCTDTTSSLNVTETLPMYISDFTVWNCTDISGEDSNDTTLLVAMMADNLESNHDSKPQAVTCMEFNATYRVSIHENDNANTITLIEAPILHNPYDYYIPPNSSHERVNQTEALSGLFMAMEDEIEGIVSFLDTDNGMEDGYPTVYGDNSSVTGMSNLVQYTWMVKDAGAGLDVDLMFVMPTLIQNITFSLLSDYLDSWGSTPLVPYNTTCFYPAALWTYSRIHLFCVYGGALLVSLLCAVIGFYAVHANGTGESLEFSRILGAIVNGELASSLSERRTISTHTELRVARGGHFEYAHR